MVEHRLQKARPRLQELGLDALLISSPENRRYLSGFTGSAGYLLVTEKEAVLATDFRYVEQGGRQAPNFRVHRIGSGAQWFPHLLAELGTKRIGFEGEYLTVGTFNTFKDALREASLNGAIELVPTSNLVDVLRAGKDQEELALITRAVELGDAAFDEVVDTIKVGDTEREIAWRLERVMREAGAESVSFDIIVASGPNAALPHHRPSDRRIQAGEPLVIDMGARYQGYCSDMTRTLCLGPADETFRRVYDTVLGAQLTAMNTIQAGMRCGEADALARDIIEKAGHGEHFGHSLGHGIGLAVHEYPRVGPRVEVVLEDGMVFTVEPGIYVTGWGGVRIEDTVVLENGRVRSLSKAHKWENP